MFGPLELINLSLLSVIGGVIVIVLTVRALRRIADSQERTVALLETLVQQESEVFVSESTDAGTQGPSPT
jgi:hypothetical protein